jgi:glutamate synthase (NADPH/NADH) small chain
VPGAKLAGVVPALDFLSNATRRVLDGEQSFDVALSAKDKRVIVLGAGDTGTDCVAVALRQKARSVVQFQRSARLPDERPADNPWPLGPRTFTSDYGQLEALQVYGSDPREYGISIKEILGDENGRVTGVITVDYQTSYDQGRKLLQELAGSERQRPAEMILEAMGFAGPEQTLIEAFDLGCQAQGTVATLAPGSYATTRPAVFVAGDMRRGQSLVVWALMEGRDAAREVHQYLQEQERYQGSG